MEEGCGAVAQSQVLDSLLRDGSKMEDFVLPPELRPNVAYDEYKKEEDDNSPVVDMGAIVEGGTDEAAMQKLVEEIDSAFVKYGFVQVKNHGVPPEVIKHMENAAMQLFALPAGSKEKGLRLSDSYMGYSRAGYNKGVVNGQMLWHEGFQVLRDPEFYQQYAQVIMKDHAQEFCTIIENYLSSMEKVTHLLIELVEHALGLEHTYLTRLYSPKSVSLRFNYYPPSPNPSSNIGLPAHTDTHVLTISYQDLVGGRQHFMDGKWRNCKPRSDCLIIDVGDTLQAISNGRYSATIHRAVVNPSKPRLSMAYFVTPIADTIIQPAPPLIDDKHVAKYKPFTWKEYRSKIEEMRLSNMAGTTVLNEYLIAT